MVFHDVTSQGGIKLSGIGTVDVGGHTIHIWKSN